MDELAIIEKIAQFGAVGIALFLAFIIWKLSDSVLRMMTNHLEHNTRALVKLCSLIDRLCEKEGVKK